MHILNYFTIEETGEILNALKAYTAAFPKAPDFRQKTMTLVRPLRAYIRHLEDQAKDPAGVNLMLEICSIASDIYRRFVPDYKDFEIFFARLHFEQQFHPRLMEGRSFSHEDREAMKGYFWIQNAIEKRLDAVVKIENPLLGQFFHLLLQCLLRDLSADCELVDQEVAKGFYIKSYLKEERYYYERLWNLMKLPRFKCWVVPDVPTMRSDHWDWQSAD